MSSHYKGYSAYHIYDLYEYLNEEIIQSASWYLNEAQSYMTNIQGRPHWKQNALKGVKNAKSIMTLAKPSLLRELLSLAADHFGKNPRHRSFNILVRSIHTGTMRTRIKNKPRKYFKYYFGIRIRKTTFKNNVVYVGSVDAICPMGRYIHVEIESKNDHTTIKLRDEDKRLIR